MKKSDLIIKNNGCLAGSDFLTGYNGHGLKDPHYSIYLGKWLLAQILFNSHTNKWYLSFEGALKGLLRRINTKDE